MFCARDAVDGTCAGIAATGLRASDSSTDAASMGVAEEREDDRVDVRSACALGGRRADDTAVVAATTSRVFAPAGGFRAALAPTEPFAGGGAESSPFLAELCAGRTTAPALGKAATRGLETDEAAALDFATAALVAVVIEVPA